MFLRDLLNDSTLTVKLIRGCSISRCLFCHGEITVADRQSEELTRCEGGVAHSGCAADALSCSVEGPLAVSAGIRRS